MDGIGSRPRLRATGAAGEKLAERAYPIETVEDVPAALQVAGDWLRDATADHAAGGRSPGRAWRPGIRSAGADRSRRRSAGLSDTSRWRRCISRIIWRRSARSRNAFRAFRRSPASIPRFTAAMATVADLYAIPRRLHEEGVRRYGFHGLSYEYIAQRLPEVAPDIAAGRVIVAHLGSGASMCALYGWAQRREHDGLYRARWPADGNAAGPARSRRDALS